MHSEQITWIGHNILGYDIPVLLRLLEISPECFPVTNVIDTLIISKLVDYSRDGHSIEDYGRELGLEKVAFSDWSKYSEAMEAYCVRDVEICEAIYNRYSRYINNPDRRQSILLEHRFQLVVNSLHDHGFAFNATKAQSLLENVTEQLAVLDKDILAHFPPRQVLVREFTPKATKHGTISKTSVPRTLWASIHEYEVGKTYPVYREEVFNPASHKQIIDVLREAGWSPIDKTKTHIDTERQLNILKYKSKDEANTLLFEELKEKLVGLGHFGWKINEANLNTLPAKAPAPARTLAQRILLESRRRTLNEWLSLVGDDSRIHGKFYGIGAWTHRMAHQNPNTANIPNEFDTNNNKKLLGKEMRSLWIAPKKRLLVGVDAEGIQLRIFAHYINDEEFTDALVRGRKEDGTDPHSLNRSILGAVCKSRAAAKRFIYALLLGAGLGKLSEILGCDDDAARQALDRLMERYTGFKTVKEEVIPRDAKRGWFVGIDGRLVAIPGGTVGSRRHLCMSGYLQNGEAVVVKDTTVNTLQRIASEAIEGVHLVNLVHDEVIFEVPNDVKKAEYVSDVFCEEIVKTGERFKLKCPLAGDGHVGLNWWEIH